MPQAQYEEDKIDLRELLRTLFRYRYFIIFTTILITVSYCFCILSTKYLSGERFYTDWNK